MAIDWIDRRRRRRSPVPEQIPPALRMLEASNPEELRFSYFVDTGEPLGSDLATLRGTEQADEHPSDVEHQYEALMEQWAGIAEAELQNFSKDIQGARTWYRDATGAYEPIVNDDGSWAWPAKPAGAESPT